MGMPYFLVFFFFLFYITHFRTSQVGEQKYEKCTDHRDNCDYTLSFFGENTFIGQDEKMCDKIHYKVYVNLHWIH